MNSTTIDYVRFLVAPGALLLSSLWLWFLVYNRPVILSDDGQVAPDLYFPTSVEDLQIFVSTLSEYKIHHWNYMFILFSSAYVFKQTFAIPGSFFLNLLSGALFGCWPLGFPLSCILTAIGATNCYLLSKLTGKKIIQSKFKSKIEWLENTIETHKDKLLWYLISLRVFPASPNWFINIASPIIGIPVHLFFVSVLLGLIPYNFLCVQAGATLSEVKSLDDVLTPKRLLVLIIIALTMLTFSHFIKKKKHSD